MAMEMGRGGDGEENGGGNGDEMRREMMNALVKMVILCVKYYFTRTFYVPHKM
jgi:hypothetical protein